MAGGVLYVLSWQNTKLEILYRFPAGIYVLGT